MTKRTRYFVGRWPHLYLVDRKGTRTLTYRADRVAIAATILAHTQGQPVSPDTAAEFAAVMPDDDYVLDERSVRRWVRYRGLRLEGTPPRAASRRRWGPTVYFGSLAEANPAL
jgi:hypothetical protein